ncbi:hypothetical protein ACPOLB_18800 [Rubrivivax sp. RP6-9]|uniref:hypothetical protein n=1 Tax=Rubrivivax sp. RP6-9 TaxID=3415750 RepID=UPI003CC6CF42
MTDDDGFALPPFDAAEGLQKLQRELRALGLAERGGVFERRGMAIAKVVLDGGVLQASTVKRPARSSPEWTHKTLRSSAELRDAVADLKKKLALWSDRDD